MGFTPRGLLLLLSVTTSAHLAQYCGHLLSLALGAQVGTELPLRNLEGTLVLTDLEQLSDTLLIWSKSSDFANEVTDHGGTLAELALASGGPLGDIPLRHLVTPVKPDRNPIAHH